MQTRARWSCPGDRGWCRLTVSEPKRVAEFRGSVLSELPAAAAWREEIDSPSLLCVSASDRATCEAAGGSGVDACVWKAGNAERCNTAGFHLGMECTTADSEAKCLGMEEMIHEGRVRRCTENG